jgi:hypothetical protein
MQDKIIPMSSQEISGILSEHGEIFKEFPPTIIPGGFGSLTTQKIYRQNLHDRSACPACVSGR